MPVLWHGACPYCRKTPEPGKMHCQGERCAWRRCRCGALIDPRGRYIPPASGRPVARS